MFFQTFDSQELLRAMGETPVHWGLWLNDELVAVWPTKLLPTLGGNVLRGWMPAIGEGFDARMLGLMTNLIVDAVKKQSMLHWSMVIREESPFMNLASRCGFEPFCPRYTYVVDTGLGSDVLWKRISKKARNAVRMARKQGLDCIEARESQDVLAFLSIYEQTMKRIRAPLPRDSGSLVRSLTRLIREEKAKLFTAHIRDKMVAGIVLLLHKKSVVWWINASLEDSWRMRPNELLVWDAIEWASNHGFQELDMGWAPSQKPEHGMHLFKRHLGGEVVKMMELRLTINRIRDSLVMGFVTIGLKMNALGLVPAMLSNRVRERRLYPAWMG
jgi:hypothetical protein